MPGYSNATPSFFLAGQGEDLRLLTRKGGAAARGAEPGHGAAKLALRSFVQAPQAGPFKVKSRGKSILEHTILAENFELPQNLGTAEGKGQGAFTDALCFPTYHVEGALYGVSWQPRSSKVVPAFQMVSTNTPSFIQGSA